VTAADAVGPSRASDMEVDITQFDVEEQHIDRRDDDGGSAVNDANNAPVADTATTSWPELYIPSESGTAQIDSSPLIPATEEKDKAEYVIDVRELLGVVRDLERAWAIIPDSSRARLGEILASFYRIVDGHV
jgi:hypothetical protein